MKTKKVTGVDTPEKAGHLVNAIVDRSQMLKDIVGDSVGEDALNKIRIAEQNSPEGEVANDFIKGLSKVINYTYLPYNVFSNKFSVFIQSANEFGVQRELSLVPTTGKLMDENDTNVFGSNKPDIKEVVYYNDIKLVYQFTWNSVQINNALNSLSEFASIVNTLIESLRESDEIAKFIMGKDLLNKVANHKDVSIEWLEVDRDTDVAGSNREILEALQNISDELTYKNDRTLSKRLSLTKKEEQAVTMTDKLKNSIKVNNLADAFNMEQLAFSSQLVTVDSFAEGSENVAFMIFNRKAFKFIENYKTMRTIEVPTNLNINYFFHTGTVLSWSPFLNVVVGKYKTVEASKFVENSGMKQAEGLIEGLDKIDISVPEVS